VSTNERRNLTADEIPFEANPPPPLTEEEQRLAGELDGGCGREAQAHSWQPVDPTRLHPDWLGRAAEHELVRLDVHAIDLFNRRADLLALLREAP
jgi:hypothetical protein